MANFFTNCRNSDGMSSNGTSRWAETCETRDNSPSLKKGHGEQVYAMRTVSTELRVARLLYESETTVELVSGHASASRGATAVASRQRQARHLHDAQRQQTKDVRRRGGRNLIAGADGVHAIQWAMKPRHVGGKTHCRVRAERVSTAFGRTTNRQSEEEKDAGQIISRSPPTCMFRLQHAGGMWPRSSQPRSLSSLSLTPRTSAEAATSAEANKAAAQVFSPSAPSITAFWGCLWK